MDEIEVLGLGRENDECELFLQGVRMATYKYSARSCYLQQGHELARLLHLHDAQVRKAWICMRSDWSTWQREIQG